MKLVYETEEEKKKREEEEARKNEQMALHGHDIKAETKEQHAKMKDRPFKEKVAYYVEYYKWPVIIGAGFLFLAISIIHAFVTAKDYCFSAMIVNSVNIDGELMGDDFGQYAGLDLKKYDCFIDSTITESLTSADQADIAASTKFTALLGSADLDITVYDSGLFYKKALNDVYADLTEVLSKEQLEAHSAKIYYIDYAEIRKADEDTAQMLIDMNRLNEERGSLEEQKKELERHLHPENMSEPKAIGIVIDDSNMVTSLDAYFDTVPVLGIIANSQRIDIATKFIDYIYDENVDFTRMQYYAY